MRKFTVDYKKLCEFINRENRERILADCIREVGRCTNEMILRYNVNGRTLLQIVTPVETVLRRIQSCRSLDEQERRLLWLRRCLLSLSLNSKVSTAVYANLYTRIYNASCSLALPKEEFQLLDRSRRERLERMLSKPPQS